MSRALATNCMARWAYLASSSSRAAYSFIIEPQPAALVTMASNSGLSMASMFWRACSRAMSRCPACRCSAPQQALRLGNVHLDTVLGQNANRRAIQLGERDAGHASDQQCNPATARRLPRERLCPDRRKEKSLSMRGESASSSAMPRSFSSPVPRASALQSRALIEANQLGMARKRAERRQNLPHKNAGESAAPATGAGSSLRSASAPAPTGCRTARLRGTRSWQFRQPRQRSMWVTNESLSASRPSSTCTIW